MSKTNHAGPCRHKPVQQQCLSCILDASDYFDGLPLDAKLALQQGMQLRAFARRERLYREAGRNDYLYILISGEVKVFKATSEGREQIHKIVSIPGDLIACEDLFLDAAGSTADAIEDTAVCCLRMDFFNEVSQRHVEISQTMLRAMARNLNAYIRHIANLGSKTAIQRVASYLIFQHKTHASKKNVLGLLRESLTRLEMAEMLGVTQRTLIRSLKELEAGRLVQLARQGYVISNLSGLIRVAEGCQHSGEDEGCCGIPL